MRLTIAELVRVRGKLVRASGMIVCTASMTMLMACGGAPERRASGADKARLLTYDQFVGVELGADRGTAERKLGPPKATWTDPSRGTCAGWDRVDERPIANKPAFIACFQEGRLTSKSILDPDSVD